MHNLSLLIISLIVAAQLPLNANAQSGRWGIAINEKSKSCARFWEGNACTNVKVPENWKPELPVWNEAKGALLLTYKDKTCALGEFTAEQCCQAFGFAFDKTFQAPTEKTKLAEDARSECFQLPAPVDKPVR